MELFWGLRKWSRYGSGLYMTYKYMGERGVNRGVWLWMP